MTTQGLIRFLFLFTIIYTPPSIISIFISASKTKHYVEKLILLEERNNRTFNNFNFTREKSGFFKDDDYCHIDGQKLYRPSESVDYRIIRKDWKIIEVP